MRLKFGMMVKCVYVRRCVFGIMPIGYEGAWQWEWPLSKRRQTSKGIYRQAQALVERLVMSKRTAS